jgi:TRAP-type transport system periplasmic protein
MNRTRSVASLGIVLTLATACGGVEGVQGGGSGGSTNLQLANPNPPTDSTAQIIDWWSAQVEEAVPDDVDIEQKYSGSLLPGPEVRTGVGEGRAAGGQLIPSYHQAEMPLSNITSVPVPYDSEVIAKAFYKLITENEAVGAEYSDAGLEPLFVGPTGTWLMATKNPVTSPEQLRGLKIRLLPPVVPAYEQFGVEPVFVAADEMYESLERGVIDGVSSVINVLYSVGVQEVAPNFAIDGIGNYTIWVFVMNKDEFDGLDDSVKEAMTEAAGKATEEGSSIVSAVEKEACEGILAGGGTITSFAEEDQDLVRTAADDLVNTWYTVAEEAGHQRADLESIWDEYNEYLEEFEPTSTYESGVEPCL